ncbi:unnamed protein product, partial [Rotaria sordida]
SSQFYFYTVKKWLKDVKWTSESSKQWQEYYNNAPRLSIFIRAGQLQIENLTVLPQYQDFKSVQCEK